METIEFKYNSIGIIHNSALDAMTELKTFPDYTLEEGYYMGVQVQKELFMFECDEPQVPSYSEIAPYYEKITKEDSFLEIIDILLKEKKISDLLAKEMKFLYGNLTSAFNYNDVKIAVDSFIEHFTKNDKLTKDEKVICWGCSSVSIFSCKYWKDVEQNPLNPWFQLFSKKETGGDTKGKFWKVVGAIACDCAGVLVGGAVGSVFGPTGAIAGATVAGAGASAAFNAPTPKPTT
ncbi:MAG: hypothetical protein PHW92_14350 [Lutibacter sp.]|jgi:hypothetical protein|nr:hypothetical protein [Lutibacter sp.]